MSESFAADGSAVGEDQVQHSTRVMAVLVALSRASGLVRLAVSLWVLGTDSALGNVYSTANTIPTIVFELLAAGALSATLVPQFRRFTTAGEAEKSSRLSAALMVWGGVGLAVVLIVVVVWRDAVARLFLHQMSNSADAVQARRLLVVLLLFFMPQMFAYLANTVATGFLHAQRRFNSSVVCPLLNNVVLLATFGIFAAMGRGRGVHITTAQIAVLGIGTTLGVVAMCAVPVVDAFRHGLKPARPLAANDSVVTSVARRGLWAALFLAGGQVVTAAALPIVNSRDGYALVWSVVFQFFLLPYALLAVPVINSRFPELTAAAQNGDRDSFTSVAAAGLRSVITTGVLAGAVLFATAQPLATMLSLGSARSGAPAMTAGLTAVAAGIALYGLMNFWSRAFYAVDDQRTPGIISVIGSVCGVGVMYGLSRVVSPTDRVAAAGLGAVAAAAVTSLGLWLVARRVLPLGDTLRLHVGGRLVVLAVAAVVARCAVGWIGSQPPVVSAVEALIVAAVVVAAFLLSDRVVSGLRPMTTVTSFGAAMPTSVSGAGQEGR